MSTAENRALDVCVVGGTRFFGARLVTLLVAAGHRVTLLTRGQASDEHGSSVRRLRADANDVHALEAALAGQHFDVVVHQVIYSPVAALTAARAFDGRTDRLIMTSTIEVYAGAASPPGGWSESDLDPTRQSFDATLPWLDEEFAGANYGRGKREAEAALSLTARMPITIVRVGHVLARDEFTGRFDWFVERVSRGGAVAEGAPSSFVHADDIAGLFAWLVQHPVEGVVNAASQPPLTPGDLIAILTLATGGPPPVGKPEPSPFHYRVPFAMATDRITAAGYSFRPPIEWLGELGADRV